MIVSIFIILPSCYLLLIVRMNKIETNIKNMSQRQQVLARESCVKRFYRLIKQLIRSLIMFMLLFVLPLFITLYIIPKYKNSNHEYHYIIELSCIGGYLLLILLLQMFGTYRSMVSFYQRTNELKEKQFDNFMNKQSVAVKSFSRLSSIVTDVSIFFGVYSVHAA